MFKQKGVAPRTVNTVRFLYIIITIINWGCLYLEYFIVYLYYHGITIKLLQQCTSTWPRRSVHIQGIHVYQTTIQQRQQYMEQNMGVNFVHEHYTNQGCLFFLWELFCILKWVFCISAFGIFKCLANLAIILITSLTFKKEDYCFSLRRT